MPKLEDLTTGTRLTGLAASGTATVRSVQWIGRQALKVIFSHGDGRLGERLLSRDEEALLELEATATLRETAGHRTVDKLAIELQAYLADLFAEFPWRVRVEDWCGQSYDLGGGAEHWSGQDHMLMRVTPEAGRDLLGLSILKFLDRFVAGEIDLEGNLYLLPEIRNYTKADLRPMDILRSRLRNRIKEAPERAKKSVTSHYDIPQQSLFYLDRVYQAYSCGIWENPNDLASEDLTRAGQGESDDWDSLERAQWKKYAHASDFLAPDAGETVLDVGCGYPGFLQVMMERYPAVGRVVGWTHSANQAREGVEMLRGFDPEQFELNEGDYREDERIFDHVHSTGMISHVGPPGRDSGLLSYVREIRRRIRLGGRYVHHAIMTSYSETPLFDFVGPTFNRKYVWPGFYWYTLGDHITSLEENGFQVVQVINLSPHYAKTIAAWYERLMAERERFVEHATEATYRAWRIFLAGSVGSCLNRQTHCYRVLCEATDNERPSIEVSNPVHNVCGKMQIVLPELT